MTPKQKVLKKFPAAELVRDGWDKAAGPSGCYDFAVYVGDWPMAFAESPQGSVGVGR